MSYKFRSIKLRDVTELTPEFLSQLEIFESVWSVYHNLENEKILYHYTNLEGLNGILESKQLWFSHFLSLNDPLEIQYGLKLIHNLINDRLVIEDDPDLRELFNSLSQNLSGFGKTMHHGFICCFCEESNQLSQWRAYSNNGMGYSIGFDFNENTRVSLSLSELKDDLDTIKSRPQVLLRKVIYDPDVQSKLVNICLDHVILGFKNGINGKISGRFRNKNYHAALMGSQAVDIFIDFLISFKHPAFIEEKEWRMFNIVLDDYDPEYYHFRKVENGQIPYRKLYLFNVDNYECSFPIRSVVVGPSLDQEISKASTSLLLHHISAKSEIIKLNSRLISVASPGYELKRKNA